MAKITIFGLAGTGTTTVGQLLAQKLGCEFVSTGNLFRQLAASLGLDLYAFEKLCNTNPDYDRKLDDKIAQFGKENNNFVLESRLGWYFVPDSFKVKVTCDLETRVKRVARRDGASFEEVKAKTLFREESGVKRYRDTYGIIDFADDKHFDLIIDSSVLNTDEIVEMIQAKLNKI